MASVDYGLTTTARVKNRLGITSSGFDTLIKRLIYGVTDRIEKMTDRRFKRATYTNEVYNGEDILEAQKRFIIVKNAPISTISSFQYDSGDNITPNWTDFIATDYDSLNDSGIIRVYQSVPSGLQNIRISYTGGYLIDFDNEFDDSSHTLPYDISEVCERVVVKLFKKREAEGRSSETFDTSSITYDADLFSKEDMSVINSYKRHRI